MEAVLAGGGDVDQSGRRLKVGHEAGGLALAGSIPAALTRLESADQGGQLAWKASGARKRSGSIPSLSAGKVPSKGTTGFENRGHA